MSETKSRFFALCNPLPPLLAEFVAEFEYAGLPVAAVWALENLTTARSGLIEVSRDSSLLAAGLVVDSCQNQSGSAELLPIALRLSELDHSGIEVLLVAAEKNVVEEGICSSLEITDVPELYFYQKILSARSYQRIYTNYYMQLESPVLKHQVNTRYEWRSLDTQDIRVYYDAVVDSFSDSIGVSVTAYDSFKQYCFSDGREVRLLWDNKLVVGFVSTTVSEDKVGTIQLIGRIRQYAKSGLGPILLKEAVASLANAGAESIRLQTTSANSTALQLYINEGFVVTEERAVFAKKLLTTEGV